MLPLVFVESFVSVVSCDGRLFFYTIPLCKFLSDSPENKQSQSR